MCHLVSIGYRPQGQVKLSQGKNLNLYPPIRVWLVIALEAQAQSKFEWPNYKSHGLPLKVDGSMGFKLSPNRSRKFLPLESDAWKVIFHWESINLHSDFL